MQRPRQVNLAAAVVFLWAAYILGFGILYTAGILRIPALQRMTPPKFDPHTFRVITGGTTMLSAAVWIPIGIGLLRLKRWARTLALVLCGIGVPMGILYAVGVGRYFGDWLPVAQVIFIATQVFLLWLLLQHPVQEAFGVSAAGPVVAPRITVRPRGVNVLIVLSVLAVLGSLALGVVYAAFLPRFAVDMKLEPEMLRMMRISMVAGVLPWVAGYALCAWGLWRLRNWARILMIVFAVLWLLPALIMLAALIPLMLTAPNLAGAGMVVFMALLTCTLPGWILWYLFQPRIKQLFTSPAPAPPSSPAA